MVSTSGWFNRTFRKVHHCFCIPSWFEDGGKDFDAKEYIRTVKEANVDCIEFYTKDMLGISYYYTRLGTRCRTGRDYLGELLSEARKSGVQIIAYYSVLWDRSAVDQHPEWVQLNSRGEKIRHGTWWQICPNSGYREIVLGQLQEIASYGVDGVWLDILMFGDSALPPHPLAGCHCENCRKSYHEQTGMAMPDCIEAGTPTARSYCTWRSREIGKLLQSCVDVVKTTNADALVIPNFVHNLVGGFSRDLARLADVISLEGYADNPFLWQPGTGPGQYGPSITARYAQSFGKPSEVLLSRFAGANSWNWTLKNEEQLAAEIFSVISNNSSPVVVDFPYLQGRLEPYLYEMLKSIYGEVRRLELWLLDREVVADFAVFYSEESTNYFRQGQHKQSFVGACKILLENHLLFEVVTPESLDRLRAKALIIPEADCLSKETLQQIRAFIQSGGRVIFSQETSLYQEDGNRNIDSLLSDFGIVEIGETGTNHCFLFADGILEERPLGPILVEGKSKLVEASRSQARFLPIALPLADTDWDHPMQVPCSSPSETTGFYSTFLFKEGAYFTIPVFSLYARSSYPQLSEIVTGLLKKLVEQEIQISAPPFVEAVAYQKGPYVVLHLVNHQQPPALSGQWQPIWRSAEVCVAIATRKNLEEVFSLPDLKTIEVEDSHRFQTTVGLHKALWLKFEGNLA